MFVCMVCGEECGVVEAEEDEYEEYGPRGTYFLVWVYCKPCDCWTQHGVEKED